jgi:hypothetical protein
VASAVSAPAADPETAPCRAGISRETATRIFAVLNRPLAEADCTFKGVNTSGSRLVALWSRAGTDLPPLSVVPLECMPGAASPTGAFVVEVPPEIGRSCPSVEPLIAELMAQVATEAPAGRHGSIHDPLFRGARLLFVAIVIVLCALLLRGTWRLRSRDARWVVTGAMGFAAALAVRAALPFSLGNWYSEVMPVSGPPPWMRFGPGYFALQSLLRDAGIWSPRTLVVSQLLLGAAAVPLLLGVLRLLRFGLAASAAALVLLIFAPFHARLSATPSEHVLAATACLGFLFCWLRAAGTGDRLHFAAAVLLFPAVCATRVDMTVQAAAVLPWPLLTDRAERDPAARRRLRWRMLAALGVVAVTTVWIVYWNIFLPSRHPASDWAGFAYALRNFLPQFWLLATIDPGWISLSSVLLAIPGALAMAVRRPWLFLRIAGTLLVAFVALGRSFVHDELVGARYFLFTIPMFLIASGYGFGTGLAVLPPRLRPVVAAAGLAGLTLWTGLAARSAYAARYAFQDEYDFARGALAQLAAGCVVYAVPVRADDLPRDVDCCLDLPRSPLVLDLPQLRLMELPDTLDAIFANAACVAYYESIACEITADGGHIPGNELAERAAAYFRRRCGDVREHGRLELLAEGPTSPRTTEGFFGGKPPHARLYRWRP